MSGNNALIRRGPEPEDSTFSSGSESEQNLNSQHALDALKLRGVYRPEVRPGRTW